MESYAILTNRKRAFIALIHSVVFLMIAVRAMAKPAFIGPIYALQGSALKASVAFVAIYLVVTAILAMLARVSHRLERLYFMLCATSAGFGLLRYSLGDPAIHVAVYVRVLALLLAVAVGVVIWDGHAPRKSAA